MIPLSPLDAPVSLFNHPFDIAPPESGVCKRDQGLLNFVGRPYNLNFFMISSHDFYNEAKTAG